MGRFVTLHPDGQCPDRACDRDDCGRSAPQELPKASGAARLRQLRLLRSERDGAAVVRDWLRRLRLHEFHTARTTPHNAGGHGCHCSSTGRNGWSVALASALPHHASGEGVSGRACGAEALLCHAFGVGRQVPWSLSIARLRPLTMPARSQNTSGGGVPEWLKGTDCKSVGARLRWFESNPLHQSLGAF